MSTATELGIVEHIKAHTLSWTANAGVIVVELAGLTPGKIMGLIDVQGTLSASAGGAATFTIHASDVIGFTPGGADQRYESMSYGVAETVAEPWLVIFTANFVVPVSGKLYFRVVPDVGTTSGTFRLLFRHYVTG